MATNVKSSDLSDAADAIWIFTTTVFIFLMQSGFALLESGCCSPKNHVNIMMKNVLDIVIGGFVYWSIGYGLQYGISSGSNAFCGFGNFFVNGSDYKVFLHFIFQLSFSSTTITIVSGAMAERCNFNAYCIFCATFCLVYCIPSGWMWRKNGFLNEFGSIDYCGATCVHLVGGIASLVAAIKLKPRRDRYKDGWKTPSPKPGNPVNVIFGTTLLWWGFLLFNSGSTFGVSKGLWKLASRAFIITILASISGGITSLVYCQIALKYVEIFTVTNGILTSMVAVCGCAALVDTYDAIYIGFVAALMSILITKLCNRLKIDDPVGAIAVHAGGGLWGTLVVGLSLDFEETVAESVELSKGQRGLFKSGSVLLLGKQIVALLAISAWTTLTVVFIFFVVNFFIKIRMSEEEEVVGGDAWVHGILPSNFDLRRLLYESDCDAKKVVQRMQTIGYKISDISVTKATNDTVITNEAVAQNNCVLTAYNEYNEITLNPMNLTTIEDA